MFSLVHIKEELQHLFGCAVDIVRLREDMDEMCIRDRKKADSRQDTASVVLRIEKECGQAPVVVLSLIHI